MNWMRMKRRQSARRFLRETTRGLSSEGDMILEGFEVKVVENRKILKRYGR